MRLKRPREKWKSYILDVLIFAVLTAIIKYIIIPFFSLFGEGIQLWAAKKVYNLFGLKTKPYIQWEKEQQKMKREGREKQNKSAEENQNKEKLLPTVVNNPTNPTASRENGQTDFRWIIDGWIAAGDIGQIVAPTKCGKTTLCVPLAYAMAKGEPTLLNPQAQTLVQQVVYYQLDPREDIFRKDYPNIDDYYPMFECCIKNGGIDLDVLIEHIRERALSTGQAYVTIFVDNINKVNQGARLVAELENLREELKKRGKTLTSILTNHPVDGYIYYMPITTKDVKGYDNNVVNADFLITLNNTRESKDVKIITQLLRRGGETKDDSIVVRRVTTPYCHFERLREAYEADMLPLKRKYGDAKDVSSVSYGTRKRGKKLGLTPEQEERIVEIYHACGDNLNAASRAVKESTEELLKDIKNFAPTQVERLLKKYENQQENNDS